MNNRIPRIGLPVSAGVTALALALAGCGNGGAEAISTGDLDGDPIRLGSVLTITNPGWDNTSVETVNEAWVSYINEELGASTGAR